MITTQTAGAAAAAGAANVPQATLKVQAQALEALLFAQMLRASGSGAVRPGGSSDGAFDGMLRDAQAQAVAASGATGLAEAIALSLEGRRPP